MKLSAAALSDVGMRRTANEDAFALAPALGLCHSSAAIACAAKPSPCGKVRRRNSPISGRSSSGAIRSL